MNFISKILKRKPNEKLCEEIEEVIGEGCFFDFNEIHTGVSLLVENKISELCLKEESTYRQELNIIRDNIIRNASECVQKGKLVESYNMSIISVNDRIEKLKALGLYCEIEKESLQNLLSKQKENVELYLAALAKGKNFRDQEKTFLFIHIDERNLYEARRLLEWSVGSFINSYYTSSVSEIENAINILVKHGYCNKEDVDNFLKALNRESV